MNLFLYLIIFLIPINLGKHFELQGSYVAGLLVDYLVPTIFIQDILVVLFLLFNIKKLKYVNRPWVKFFIWFLLSGFFSALVSLEIVISLSVFFRTFFYGLLMYLISINFKFSTYKDNIIKALMLSTFLLSLLGVAQWFHQGSIFDNYLFFGEQPYNLSTYSVNIENFFGETKVPSYGLFRHPNVFGAYLSITLIWIFSRIKDSKGYLLIFLLGTIALFFTLSKFAIIAFLLGLFLINLNNLTFKKYYKYFLILGIVLTLIFYITTKFIQLEDASFYRRQELLQASIVLVNNYPLYGVGPGLFTHALVPFLNSFTDSNFIQPVHNLYLLLLSEYGLISSILFGLFIYYKTKNFHEKKILLISLIQMLFLGTFDHYVFTSHQIHLFFWILLGFI